MDTKLTVIIPFRNEGDEVASTVQSLKETAAGPVAVILVNDSSNDGHDYKAVAKRYKCKYIINKDPVGVATSRNIGVEFCETEHFLIIDAHMRFYTRGWDTKLLAYLEQYPDSVLCCRNKTLNKDSNGNIIEKSGEYHGAYIDILGREVFSPAWCNQPCGEEAAYGVPCIMGAAYATSRNFWYHIHGLRGLTGWGCDEELLSIKTWNAGGGCIYITDIVIGHLYRKSAPYPRPKAKVEHMKNMLFCVELLMPEDIRERIHARVQKSPFYAEAVEMLEKQRAEIDEERAYLRSIEVRSVYYFLYINLQIRNQNLFKTIKNNTLKALEFLQ